MMADHANPATMDDEWMRDSAREKRQHGQGSAICILVASATSHLDDGSRTAARRRTGRVDGEGDGEMLVYSVYAVSAHG